MGAHLITGYGGKEHITAADQGLYNAGTLGDGKYVLPIGSMFDASIITNNLVKIKDGCLVNQGRNINIAVNDYEECEIDNGIQALKRNDLIVIRYEKNADTGIETASTIVIKGVSGETAVDPEYTTGNIFNGDNVDDFPLYRVKLEGLNITAVEPLFNTIVSFKTLTDTVDSLNKGLANTNDDVSALNTNLGKKVNTSDIVNTLTSTATNKPLSAYQGNVLKKSIDDITASPTWVEVTTGIIKIAITNRAGNTHIMCSSAPGVRISANTWTILITIDTEYSPTMNTPFIGSYGTVTFIGYVYTNGNIVVYTPTEITTSGNAMCFNISYPV